MSSYSFSGETSGCLSLGSTSVGALLLLAVDRNLGPVHVQHHLRRRIYGFDSGGPIPLGSLLAPAIQFSNDCRQEVIATPRSQIFSEATNQKVGPCERDMNAHDDKRR